MASARVRRLARAVARRGQREACRHLGVAHGALPEWQLFLTVMSESHSAGENLGHVLDAGHPMARLPMAERHRAGLHEVYRAMDAAIGRIADGLPPDAVLVVFSILGTAANDAELSSTALLPELLHRLHWKRPFLRDPDEGARRRERPRRPRPR